MKTINPINEIKVNDIFVYSWGYDQTNIDFFQVIRKTKKCIIIRKIKSKNDYDNQSMTGYSMPDINNFEEDSKELRKIPYKYLEGGLADGCNYISFECGCGYAWDGSKQSYSDYA